VHEPLQVRRKRIYAFRFGKRFEQKSDGPAALTRLAGPKINRARWISAPKRG